MSLIINFEWFPQHRDVPVEPRVEQVARVLARDEITAVMGSRWYELGRSRAQALARPIDVGAIASWKQRRLGAGETTYVLGAWNGGGDGGDAVALYVELHAPSSPADGLTLDGPTIAIARERWPQVLAMARMMAAELGGRSIVRSHALNDWARDRALEEPLCAAYAAFWGPRASEPAKEHVSAPGAADLDAPSAAEVEMIIRLTRPQS